MKGISSDVIALAAVLGGAAVAGVVTLALVSGDRAEEYAYECIVTEVETAPHVMLSLSTGGSSIVVAPDVSFGTSEACASVHVERIELEGRHLDRAHERMDRARERVERTQERVEHTRRVVVDRLERVDHSRRVDLAELRKALELELGGRAELDTDRILDEMEKVEEEMKRVEEELKRRRRRPGRGGN
jgi:hypothetical protein